MPGEPQIEVCMLCGFIMMPDNAVRCQCGWVMCFACFDDHACEYTMDPEYDPGVEDVPRNNQGQEC